MARGRRSKTPDTSSRPAIAVGYIRVSTDEQHLGPEVQRAALQAWSAARSTPIATVFEDLGVSGTLALHDRPGLLAAVDALEDLGASMLVAHRRDRFARDVIVAAQLERLVQRSGAQLASVDGVGEGDGPEAELMRRLVDAFAAYEVQLIRRRTRDALRRKRARGEIVGSIAPYGWSQVGQRLVPVASEVAAIEFAVTLDRQGASLRDIANALQNAGHAPRGQSWHPQTVQRLLAQAKFL